jgi:hypothetical protein
MKQGKFSNYFFCKNHLGITMVFSEMITAVVEEMGAVEIMVERGGE